MSDYFDDLIPELGDPSEFQYLPPYSLLLDHLVTIGWETKYGAVDPSKNIFLDGIPKNLYSSDNTNRAVDGNIAVIVIQHEPVQTLPSTDRFTHKFTDGAVVSVFSGSKVVASHEAGRLHRYLLRPEVAYSSSYLKVLRTTPVTPPSLVGVDDSEMAEYSFRVMFQAVWTYPDRRYEA